MAKIELCEACQKNPWTLTEDDDKGLYPPYRLCAKCHQRLIERALRPREWYNLAVLYGPYRFLLHDDFYDDDGIAQQPDEEHFSISPEDYAPQLQDVVNDLSRLIEYCATRYSLDESLIEIFLQYDKKELLMACRKKYDSYKYNRDTPIKIAGSVLGETAASWVREIWNKGETINYSLLSEAAIKSLPSQEAFNLITTYLKTVPPKELPDEAISCLHLLRSPIILNWMEQNVNEYRDAWARLAACSSPTWGHMHKWISKGRPLSLVALETMANCAPPYDNVRYLSQLEPKIREAPSYRSIEKALLDYEKLDNVPRVNNAVAFIRVAAPDIFIGKKFENPETLLGKFIALFK